MKTILNDFVLPFYCSDDKLRPSMMQPSLLDNGKVCALNPHTVISIPQELCVKNYPKVAKFPNVESVLIPAREGVIKEFSFKTDDLAHILTQAKWTIVHEGTIECDNCEGNGTCICTCGHEHECEECFGEGGTKKPHVEFGLLKTAENFSVSIDGMHFSANYLHIISVTAKILTADTIKIKMTDDNKALFYFSDVEILLMALLEGFANGAELSSKLLVEIN